MAATALGNIPLSTTIYPSADVDAALSGLASGVSEEIASAVSTAWKAGGSKAPTDLTSALLVAANEGKVYNMSASGTTDSNFMEGSGKPYTAGTDIAVINNGTAASPDYKFNVLATQDSSVVKQIVPGPGNPALTPTNGSVTIPFVGPNLDGLMSSGEHKKLSGIAAGAEVNQNAFSKIAVSGVAGTGDAASTTDTLTLVPGDNVTMSRSGKSVTINAQVPSGVVQGFVTDGPGPGTVTPDGSGNVDIHGSGGISVVKSGDNIIIVDGSSIPFPVTDGKISGGSSLLSGTTIVIPVASTSAKGVTQLTDSVSNSATTAITPNAVSGAISGVNSGLATKVSGGTLHTNLVSNGHSNPSTTPTSGTIYSLIKALHASDNTAES